MSVFSTPLTWTCHICGKERPDSAISVQKNYTVVNAIRVQQNVRYCNDRPSCIEAAPHYSFLGRNGTTES